MSDQPPIRVLSIDGGGMRGIIPATFLAWIEQELGKRTYELFDLVAGTSTGGIVALALLRGNANGESLNDAATLAAFYENEGPEVFVRKRFSGKAAWIPQLGQKPNPSQFIEDALDAYLVDMRLSETLTSLVVPAYEIMRREPFVFSSEKAREDPAFDFECADVAQATSAAPSYFPPVQVQPAGGDSTQTYTLVDGGVWANNPSLVALLEAKKRWPAREIALLSLGTGSAKASYSYETAKEWRTAQWARPGLSIVLDAVSDGAHAATQQLVGSADYLRLDPLIDPSDNELDRTDPEFLARLRKITKSHISERQGEMEEFLPKLAVGS